MRSWYVRTEDYERQWTERYILTRLRDGHLHGGELVREGETDPWVPLHTTAMWTEAMGPTSPRTHALTQTLQPVATHFVVWAVMMVAMGFPSWGIWWFLGLAAHITETAFKAWPLLSLPSTPAPPAPAIEADASAPETPLLLAVDRLITAIDGRPADDPLRAEIAGLRDAAAALEARVDRLDALLADTDLQALHDERDALRADPARARQLAALEERLRAADQLAATRADLDAERSAMLHQVQGLRLALASLDAADPELPDLVGRVRDLRVRAGAEREVAAITRRAASEVQR